MAVLGWKELRALNNQRQHGDLANVPEEEWLEGWDRNAPDAQEQYDKRYHDTFVGNKAPASERMEYLARLQEADLRPKYTEEDVLNSGYGDSKFDYKVPFDQWIKDPINYRSNTQTAIGQITNGLLKMGAYGIATYADNIAGLINGLANVGIDAVNGDGFRPTESFINNWTSDKLQQLRDWSDRVMPNYRTREEEEDQDRWWRHLNANFIGDTFIKNLGFTIGAGLSGGTYSRLFRASQGKLVNKAYKAALAAAGGDAEAEAAFRSVLQGGKMQSAEKIYNTFEKTRKSFNRLNWESQLVGGIGGAMGESRMEAMMAAKEFRDGQNMYWNNDYETKKQLLQDSVMSNPVFLTEEPVYDGYGNVMDSRPALNAAGKKYYADELAKLQQENSERQTAIDDQAARLANFTYWLNMPVLTGSNIIMFGRMFAGGFKTQAKAKVRGNFGNYRQSGNRLTGAGRVLGTSISEGMEELTQKVISEGMKDIAGQNVASFHNGKYDENAIKDVSSWLASVVNTAGNVITDPTSLEEFAIGFITGGLSSTVMGELGNVRRERTESAEMAKKLNERISSPEFKALWEGLVRHKHYEDIKDVLMDSKVNGTGEEIKDRHGNPVGTQFAWQTAQDEQIISDVTMFADAGKLDDLESYVDSFARITEDDLPDIETMLSDDTVEDFDKKTPEEKVDWVKDRANQIKKAINQYRDFYNAIDFLSFGTSDKEAINELIFTQSQLQNFEDRYNNLLDTVVKKIRPTIEEVAKERKADGTPTKDAKIAQQLLESEDDMRRLFGGRALDLRGLSQGDNASSPLAEVAVMLDDRRQQAVMDNLEEWGTFTQDPELKQQVKDLQSLVRSRQDFYARLFNPRGRKSFAERFEEEAKTPGEVVDKISDEARARSIAKYIEKLNSASNLKEYVQTYRSEIPELDVKSQKMLDEEIAKNDKLRDFEKKVSDAYDFFGSVVERVDSDLASPSNPQMIKPLEELQTYLSSVEDLDSALINMPEGTNPVVAIAKMIVDATAGNKSTNALARAIVQEKLGDLAQAAGLGTLAPGSDAQEDPGKEVTVASYKKKDGTTVDSKFIVKKDSDVYVKAERASSGGAMIKWGKTRDELTLAGVTDDDLGRSDWEQDKPGEWDDIMSDADKLRVERVVQRPDGSTYVEIKAGDDTIILDDGSGNNIQTTGNPKKVLLALSPELAAAVGITEQDPGTVGGGEVTQFNHLSELIDAITDVDNADLQALASGDFSKYFGLSDNDKAQLAAKAQNRIETLNARKGIVASKDGGTEALGTDDRPDDDPNAIRARQEFTEMQTSSLSLSPFTVYVPSELKRGRVKRFVSQKKNGVNETLNWMRNHHVQEFIDSGALALLEEKYRKEGKKLPVYFVANPHYIADNKENNPFVGLARGGKYKNTVEVLAAIEITDENRAALKSYEDAGVFNSETLITIGDKQYQVIGEMWNPSPDEVSNKGDAAPLYAAMKEQAKKVWDYAIARSIKPQYDAEVAKSGTAVFPATGKWYLAKIHPATDTQQTDEHDADWTTGEPLYTTLNYIMSGRNETRAIGKEDYEKIPLANSLSDYESVGGEYHFSLMAKDSSTGDDITYSSAQAPAFPPSIYAPRGSLWMATKAANGQWEWTAVRIQRTDEFDFAANEGSNLMKRFNAAVDTLLGPVKSNASAEEREADFAKRMASQAELKNMFYLGKGNLFYFAFEESGPVVYVGGAKCTTKQDVIDHLKEAGYRFQVNAAMMSDPDMLFDLMDAGALTSEMRSFIRRGASVGVNFLEDRGENGELVPPYPRQSNEDVARTPGSNFNEAVIATGFDDGAVSNVQIGSVGYQLREDGTVYYMASRGRAGDKVEDSTVIAQVKAVAELMHGKPKNYGGKSWVIDNRITDAEGKTKARIQYTELYERVINDVKVHLIRRGENGAIRIAFGDEEWNALMNAEGIKEMGGAYSTPKPTEAAAQAAAEAEFDKMRADEERAAVSITGAGKKRGRRKESSPTKTVQQIEKQRQKDDEVDDCDNV